MENTKSVLSHMEELKMKNKTVSTIIVSILTILGGMAFNFQEFLMGSPATIKNLTITFAYIILWVLILAISIKSKNHRVMKYYSVFWILTLATSIITVYVNITGAQVDWVIPFAILLLGQWYGINFFAGSFLVSSIIIAFISLLLFIIAMVGVKREKSA